MKRLFTMLCVAACFSTPVFAQEKKPTTDDLVKAAKTAKAKRRQPTSKVLTNKDVKKSKGKLIVLDTRTDKPVEKTDKTSPIEKQDAHIRARKEAQARVDTAQQKVDSLQKQLDEVEQRYYEENDPNYRDQVIQQKFGETRQRLDAARHELDSARDSLQKIEAQK